MKIIIILIKTITIIIIKIIMIMNRAINLQLNDIGCNDYHGKSFRG
jgi:hypothetical protein